MTLQSPQLIARRFLPAAVYRRLAALWHLRGKFPWVWRVARERGRPEILIHFGTAPGDDLLCTIVVRELAGRGQKKIWMMSNYPELFEGNADVAQVVPAEDRFQDYAILMCGKLQQLEYAPIDWEKDQSKPPGRHIIAELCVRAGINGSIAVHPHLHLSAAEKEKQAWAGDWIAIQSSGLAGRWPMRNKQWFPERFQQVVDRLKDDFQFVQIGSQTDPLLQGTTDLRGKTSIRETAAILSNCRLYVGNVGFLMHLARAVECPSVIIFGGREAPWQSGYTCNINLYSDLPCAPCWLWNRCDYNHKCMDIISTDAVVAAIEEKLRQPRENLAVDYLSI
jgi:hypothetical protein